MKRLFFLVLWTCLALHAYADSLAPNLPKIFFSPTGAFYLKLVPESRYGDKGKGEVYSVEASEEKLLYQTNGWYSHSVILSLDGTKIARRGPWANQNISPNKTLGIAFYDQGKLMSEFMVSDLMMDMSCIVRTVSHYFWSLEFKRETKWDDEKKTRTEVIQIETLDGQTIRIDLNNGKMMERKGAVSSINCNTELLN